jgi:hypothetical protein
VPGGDLLIGNDAGRRAVIEAMHALSVSVP